MINALKVHLKAPLMSTTDDSSNWGTMKKSYPYPTKSQIVGMIGCAFNIPNMEDPEIKVLKDCINVYVSVEESDIGNVYTDYQTAGSCKKVFHKASSRNARKIIEPMRKEYRVGADYYLYVTTNNSNYSLDDIAHHLDCPENILCIGRHNCIPACRFNCGIHEISQEVLDKCILLR